MGKSQRTSDSMVTPVSLIIVNYKTPKQTKLCLRSIRRFTRQPCETIVVDNHSGDESSEYLRRVRWIRLIENDRPEPSHRNGLDLAIARASSDKILILHTDTFVRREDWLETLLERMEPETMILGTHDRVIMPFHGPRRLELWWKRRKRVRYWKKKGVPPKIHSHCALYRRELFTTHGQRFDCPEFIDGVYIDTGEFIQRYCEDRRLGIQVLTCEELWPLMWHFEGATLNVVTGRKIAPKRRRGAEQFYRRPEIQTILNDSSLDE